MLKFFMWHCLVSFFYKNCTFITMYQNSFDILSKIIAFLFPKEISANMPVTSINSYWSKNNIWEIRNINGINLHHKMFKTIHSFSFPKEIQIAFSSCKYNIHPNPHCFRCRSHQVINSVIGFYTKCWLRTRTFYRMQMINIYFLYIL